MRPVAELMFVDFMGVCFDEIFNQAAKFRYMFGGKATTPVVIRCMAGAGFRAAAQHSQMLTPLFTHIPGLKVVFPSNAYDAKGLLIQSIRDNDPVIFLEHKNLYASEADVPEESYAIPFGEANVVREGSKATIVTYGQMVGRSLEAADDTRQERHRCRGDRPPDDVADRLGYDPRIGREDRPPRLRRRGPSALLDRLRRLRQGLAGGVQVAEGRHPDGDGAAHPGAVLGDAGRPLYPERRADRHGGERRWRTDALRQAPPVHGPAVLPPDRGRRCLVNRAAALKLAVAGLSDERSFIAALPRGRPLHCFITIGQLAPLIIGVSKTIP